MTRSRLVHGLIGVAAVTLTGCAPSNLADTSGGRGGNAPGGSGGASGGTGRGAPDGRGDAGSDSAGSEAGSCEYATGTTEGFLFGADGMLLASPVQADVTVTSVDACTNATCPRPTSVPATRIILTAADQRSWTLAVRIPGLPGDFVKVADAFKLDVAVATDTVFYPTVDQTVVLARGGQPLLFTASTLKFGLPPLPSLDAYGIALADAGALCEFDNTFCVTALHGIRVTHGGMSAVIADGQTLNLGGLSITSSGFHRIVSGCDGNDIKTELRLGGFLTP